MSAMREAFAKLGIEPQQPARAEPKRAPLAADFKMMTGVQIEATVRDLEHDVRRIDADLEEDLADGTSERGEAWRAAAAYARTKRQDLIAAAKREIERRRTAMPDAERERRRAAVAAALQIQEQQRRRDAEAAAAAKAAEEAAEAERRRAEAAAAAAEAKAAEDAAEAARRSSPKLLRHEDHLRRLALETALAEQKARTREADWAAAREQRMAAWERRQARRARLFLLAAKRALSEVEWARVWAAARERFPDAPEWGSMRPPGSASARPPAFKAPARATTHNFRAFPHLQHGAV
jgi:hypothetical protein